MAPKVNKWRDLLDRAGWTAIQATAGVTAAYFIGNMGWKEVLATVCVATAGSILKVKTGQNTGTDETGSLIGMPVIEPAPK